jgi:hypothetical protein
VLTIQATDLRVLLSRKLGPLYLGCSGTKIGQNVILTAAHCVDDGQTKGLAPLLLPGKKFILTNQIKGNRTGGDVIVSRARKIHLHPSWIQMKNTCDPETAFQGYCWVHNTKGAIDIAVIETEESLEQIPAAIFAASTATPGDTVTIVGYGQRVTDIQKEKQNLNWWQYLDGSRRYGVNTVGDSSLVKTYRDITGEYLEGVSEYLHETNILTVSNLDDNGRPMNTWSGDSGSPLLFEKNGLTKIIGVLAGSLMTKDNVKNADTEYPPYAIYAKIDTSVEKWLWDKIQNVELPIGNAPTGREFFSCKFDGIWIDNFIARENSKSEYHSIYSSSQAGFNDPEIRGLIEDDINTITVTPQEGTNLILPDKTLTVGRMVFRRTKDLSTLGVYWEADSRFEVTENGVNKVLTPSCIVYGKPGSLGEFAKSNK